MQTIQSNHIIRNEIENAGLKYWQVAYEIGIADATFSRWLRVPLTHEQKQDTLNAIKKLKREKAHA